jgi:hypothetical protein
MTSTPGQPAEVLLADGLVDGGAAPDTLPIVMGRVGPPVCLHLDVTKNHVFDGGRKSRNFPRNVGLPAAESFRQVLQDGPGLVLLDSFRHHVEDVVHDGGAKFQIEVGLHSLLRHRLGHALRVAALELPGEKVPEPPLEQRRHAAQEKEPNSPARRPKAAAGALADGSLRKKQTLIY